MKWIYKFIICLVIFLTFSVPVSAERYDDFEYEVKGSPSYVSITEYKGTSKIVFIPDNIDGLPVREVSLNNHFHTDVNPYVREVILPETVVNLNNYAFTGCAYMTKVEGLDHIRQIGELAFYGCERLTEGVFSSKLQGLANNSFEGSGFISLTVPDDLQIEEINPFGGANSLMEIVFVRGSGEKTLVLKDGVLFSNGFDCLICYPGGREGSFYKIPEGTRTILRKSFNIVGQTGLCDVVIPESVNKAWFDTFFFTHAAHFFVHSGCGAIGVLEECKNYYLNWDLDYYQLEEELITVDDYIINIIEKTVKSGMSELEKAYAIIDYFADNMVYDTSITNASVYVFLTKHYGVCQAYAETYKLIMDALDIPCVLVGNFNHIFNAILIDGNWIYIDPTKCIGDNPVARYMMFGFDDTIFNIFYGGQDYDKEIVSANTCRYHYYYTSGMLDGSIRLLEAGIQNAVNDGCDYFEVNVDSLGFMADYNVCGSVCASILTEMGCMIDDQVYPVRCNYIDGVLFINLREKTDESRLFDYQVVAGCAMLTDYKGNDEDIIVPSSIDGYTVTNIGQAFTNNYDIRTVTIPETVMGIGSNAFYSCVNLESINIPRSLKLIGDSAFEKCYSLNCDMILPEGLESIGTLAFGYCYLLPSVTIPGTVDTIPELGFLECRNLSNITLKEGIKNIQKGSFTECRMISSICLPESLLSIWNGAFSRTGITSLHIPSNVSMIEESIIDGCDKLTELTVGGNNLWFSSIDNVLYMKENNLPVVLKAAPMGAEYRHLNIPDTVIKIEANAFRWSKNIYKVTIPSSIRVIGDQAFRDCTNITNIYFSEGLEEIGDSVFLGCKELKELWLPDSVHSIGNYNVFGQTIHLRRLNIPKGVTELSTNVGLSVFDTIHIYVHDNVTYLPAFDTYGDPNLVYVHGNVGTYSQEYAEKNGYIFCTDTDPTIKASADVIYTNYNDVNDTTGQFSFSLPLRLGGIQEISSDQVQWTSNDISIILPETSDSGETKFLVKGLGNALLTAAYGNEQVYVIVHVNDNIMKIPFPSSLSLIGADAFSGTQLNGYIDFREYPNVKISESAFSECNEIKYIVLGMDTNMDDNAFNGLDNGNITVFCANRAQADYMTQKSIPYAIWND